jgi:cysteine-rich repeat protein
MKAQRLDLFSVVLGLPSVQSSNTNSRRICYNRNVNKTKRHKIFRFALLLVGVLGVNAPGFGALGLGALGFGALGLGAGCGGNTGTPPGGDGGTDGGQVGECGNGMVEGVETCDDGNRMDGDGCNPHCQLESGWSCEGEPSTCVNLCGNGVLDEKEQCDGEAMGGATCETVEGAFTGGVLKCSAGCVFDTTECILPGCGDGVLDFGEECDDGNVSNEDACLNNCHAASCGVGYVWQNHEACDDANASNNDACLNNCQAASCGDGYVWQNHEVCDDGNTSNNDACTNTCHPARCGDGHIWQNHEACDDANASNNDACLNTCQAAFCGDGFVRIGVEDCESGVCCASNCHFSGTSTLCRGASGECELAEYCTGAAASCPADAHVADGTFCSIGICEDGQCVVCEPNTGSFCNSNDQQVQYNCGCGEPDGDGWVDQGNGCYQRFPNFCNGDNVLILWSCGCGEPTTGGWVDQGNDCYHKNTAQPC